MNDSWYFIRRDNRSPGYGPDMGSIILSSRASISRNLANYKFPTSCKIKESKEIMDVIRNCASKTGGLSDLCFLDMAEVKKNQRLILINDYQIEKDFISKLSGRGILVMPRHSTKENAIAVPLCWDDHIKIQVSGPGNVIREVYNKAVEIEKLFERRLSFAFDSEWGYLTSDPANLGTALEVSFLAHIPALSISSDITDFINRLIKVGCTVRGFGGMDNDEITGNIVRISSAKTLGRSEEDIVEEMHSICLNIIEEEKDSRKILVKKDLLGAEDNIYRSYGLVEYAKILSFEESIELLSILRLGVDLGLIDKVKNFDLFGIINMINDYNIASEFEMGIEATEDDIDQKRAEFIRKAILED
jgi:protein arginine kinase